MEIVDAQVHVWEHHNARHPWDAAHLRAVGWQHFAEDQVTADDLIRSMDEAGVAAALVVTPQIYGSDNGYSLAAAERYPGRLAVVGRIDPTSPDVEDVVSRWRTHPSTVGIRIVVISEEQQRCMREGGLDALLAAAEAHGVPVAVYPPFCLTEVARIAGRFAELQLVVDHLGLVQPPLMVPGDAPFERITDLIELARHPNVSVKLSGLPTLSASGFPFPDVWPYVERVLDAYGVDRIMWGSDFTRVRELHTYSQAVEFIANARLSLAEKQALLSGTLRRIFGWPGGTA